MGVSGLADLVLARRDARRRRWQDARGGAGPRPRPDRARRRCGRSWSRGSSTPAAPCSRWPRPPARPRTSWQPLGGLIDPAAGRPTTRPGRRCRTSGCRPRSDTVGRRLAVLRRLRHPGADASNGPVKVVVAPVRSVLQPQVKGLADLEPVELAVGDEVELDDVVRRLAGAAYSRVDLVEKRGEFAVRGGIVDVFPPTEEHPLRVEFWGDEVEEIRSFAVADQRTLEPVERLWAPPCRELLLTDEVRGPRRGARRAAPAAAPRSPRSSPTATPSRAWSRWPRCSSTTWRCSSTCCRPTPTCWCSTPSGPAAGPTTWSRPARSSSRRRWAAAAGGRQAPDRPRRGVVPLARPTSATHEPGAGQGLVERVAVRPRPGGRDRPSRCATRSARSSRPASTSRPAPSSRGRCRPAGRGLPRRHGARGRRHPRPGWRNDSRVVAACTRATARPSGWSRCSGEHDVAGAARRVARRASPSRAWCTSPPATLDARLRRRRRSAWRVLTGDDLSGQRASTKDMRKMPARRKKQIDPLELKAGDYVVHEQHGVGRYVEMKQREVQGATREYLVLEYGASKRGGPPDRLYVPDRRARPGHPLRRRRAARRSTGSAAPTGPSARAAPARRSAQIAAELIKLYAARQATQGHAFGPDTPVAARARGRLPVPSRRPTSSRTVDEVKARHGAAPSRWTGWSAATSATARPRSRCARRSRRSRTASRSPCSCRRRCWCSSTSRRSASG